MALNNLYLPSVNLALPEETVVVVNCVQIRGNLFMKL